jgi:hypothetical protein
MRTIRALFVGLLVLLCVSCSDTDIDTSLAKPYDVVRERALPTATGRDARMWDIVADSSTFEEHAQTIARALLDMQREHGTVLNEVSLYPTRSLAGSAVKHGYGFYATDGKAGEGLPGADPEYRARWRIFATERALTEQEIEIAELWMERAPDFPSQDPFTSMAIDGEALRASIAEELALPIEEVVHPHPAVVLWLEVID